MKQLYIFIILFLVLNLTAIVVFQYNHESAHTEIAKIFGCEDVSIDYFILGGRTSAECTLTKEEDIAFNIAQSNVEAIGYQLYGLMNFFMLNILMFGLMIFWRRE